MCETSCEQAVNACFNPTDFSFSINQPEVFVMALALADAVRCAGDAICLRVHALEPQLPIAPDWITSSNAACRAGEGCMPWVHLLGEN